MECPADGMLQLRLNDTDDAGNTGEFDVAIADPTDDPSVLVNPVTPTTVEVPGAVQWTSSGIRCEPGAVYQIRASGIVSYDPREGRQVTPAGRADDPGFQPQWNLPGLAEAPHSALVASLDGQPPFSLVGESAEFACERDGDLQLGPNDAGVQDNAGSFSVTVTKSTSPG